MAAIPRAVPLESCTVKLPATGQTTIIHFICLVQMPFRLGSF
jgi:hypothetical protein